MWQTDSLKRPWCWGRLKAGGEGDNRGWDGGMASLTQWTWVWASSGSWWWPGRPAAVHGAARVGHDWETELKAWKQPKCTSKDPGVVHACHGIHSALRKKDILPFGTIRLDLEGIMLSEKSDREGQILHGLTCMWNLKKKKKKSQTYRNRE